MSVNKYKILNNNNQKYLNIPVEIKWDFIGKDDSVDEYEKTILEEIIGTANDFEICRFSHQEYLDINQRPKTEINHKFNFYANTTTPVSASTVTISDWSDSYLNLNFSTEDIYFFRKPFTKSFFKLDFYDTPSEVTQNIYFTIILPVQQGLTQTVNLSIYLTNIKIRKPNFKLDFLGDKEGFFIYWLRDRNYIDLSEFYMSAKFFNGRTGNFIRMMNRPQIPPFTPTPFTFNTDDYFYYKLKLDYTTKTYQVFSTINPTQVVGQNGTPIVWYEYVNP
jgi:hypothetical protein